MKRQLLQTLAIFLVLTSCNNTDKTSKNDKQTDSKTTEIQVSVIEPNNTKNGSINGNFGGCGYNYTPSEDRIALYEPRPRELSQINSILKFSGLASNFKIYSASIDNAVATIIDNKRYILYDPKLLSYTDIKSGSYWSSMSILAHEIGHHLSGHTITNKGSNPKDELEADKYSGFVLYKLGATLADATNAIRTLGSEIGSTTHPPKTERIKAITQGWNEANQTRYDGAIPPPPPDITNFDGGISEFNTENLLDQISYSELKSKNGYGYWVSDKWEGIITEAEEKNGNYQIYITKVGKLDSENGYKDFIGQKVWISLYDPWDARQTVGRAGLSWLYSILVTGRRIQFAFGEEGTAPSRYFAYIKYLPAK